MSKLNFPREDFTKKVTEAMTKFKSLRQDFRNREKKIRADLEKARKIWEQLGKKFKWWQSLP